MLHQTAFSSFQRLCSIYFDQKPTPGISCWLNTQQICLHGIINDLNARARARGGLARWTSARPSAERSRDRFAISPVFFGVYACVCRHRSYHLPPSCGIGRSNVSCSYHYNRNDTSHVTGAEILHSDVKR